MSASDSAGARPRATTLRDVALLAAQGYALDAVTGYDLFPMTHHVEAVAVLTR